MWRLAFCFLDEGTYETEESLELFGCCPGNLVRKFLVELDVRACTVEGLISTENAILFIMGFPEGSVLVGRK